MKTTPAYRVDKTARSVELVWAFKMTKHTITLEDPVFGSVVHKRITKTTSYFRTWGQAMHCIGKLL